MVDRAELLGEMTGRLHAGQSLLLAGPRRTGKSGLGREVLRRLAAGGAYVADVDLFRVTSVEELAVRLLASVAENRMAPWPRAVKSLSHLAEVLRTATVAAKLHDLELALSFASPTITPLEALDVALAAGEKMAARDGRRLVVLLDEFQEVERLGGLPLLQRMRSVMQSQPQSAYLFLGSQPSLLRALFAQQHSAFYRFALPLPMPPVPDAAWREYLVRKLGQYGVTITGAAASLLLERTGGHPWCTMEVVSEAWVLRGGAPEIDAEHVALGYGQALTRLTPVYEALWLEVRRTRHADAVLGRISDGLSPYSGSLNSAAVTRALHHLTDTAVLERGPGRGEYVLVEKMFGDWVRAYSRF